MLICSSLRRDLKNVLLACLTGIVPIVTSSLAMQLMAGSKIIDVNQGSREDRALFGGAQKVGVQVLFVDVLQVRCVRGSVATSCAYVK